MKISGNIYSFEHDCFLKSEIFIADGVIKSIVPRETVPDIWVVPGLVDAHVHVESSMVSPVEYARISLKNGVLGAVSDPHEIANVCGLNGVRYMKMLADLVPFSFVFGAPSCVPSTEFDGSGYSIDASDVEVLLEEGAVSFIAEVMDYPGIISGKNRACDIVKIGKERGLPVDGHAPGLSGENLKIYVESGIGTDHECSSEAEAREKLALGMKILIREGSAAKDFDALADLISEFVNDVMICTDDTHTDYLIDGCLKKIFLHARKKGISYSDLFKVMCKNSVEHYNVNLGLLREGDDADFVVLSDLESYAISDVFYKGNSVIDYRYTRDKIPIINNFLALNISEDDIKIEYTGERIKVIKCTDKSLITEKLLVEPAIDGSLIVPDVDRDILKIVVLNRYGKAKPSVGFIHGFGLNKGAIVSTVSHDSHNIVAIGTDDKSIVSAINSIVEIHGGIGVMSDSKCELLPLPIAGLMSDEPAEIVRNRYEFLVKSVVESGCELDSPFMTMAFMSLIVVPSLKISDRGLFDVDAFKFVNLYGR